MMTEIYITTRQPGFHSWPEAPESVAFLRAIHRHLFHFKLGVVVTQPDRQVEFFLAQAEFQNALQDTYEWAGLGYVFGNQSCEMIAQELIQKLPFAAYLEVSEDGENGAVVYRSREDFNDNSDQRE